MELDDFKAHWNIIQDKEFQQQKISPEKMEQIIMNTTETLSQLQSRTIFWKQINKTTTTIVITLLVVVLLLRSIDDLILHKLLADIPAAIAYAAIIALYCKYTVWVFKRQEQVFILYNSANVKQTLKQTITAFKAFYWGFNFVCMFLCPLYYYAVIKLLIPYWHASQQTILITCVVATVISLIGSHWYYSVKFFKKLRSLDENLKELESQEG
ncbi:hypothetical protein [Mucilaginibacter sp. dw_454]|uniref:hypothetical protein n=1 Tax=Mucilaginibacter sp. dw_454 TaxID=2720079 RepID=UPI001BD3DA77|nr:hypothetical protein [Mucilaginibacter sp. dw_454]